MRLVLTTAIAALVLSGCAGNYGKSADASLCESSKPPDVAVTSQFFPSSGLNVPGRSVPGSGKISLDDTMTYACIDPKRNKTNTPGVPNLHRIELPRAAAI
ncbi:MAG TPA: hypothetical protein VHM27_01820 [Rhizomicrobium sp.]|nr:hypothetical protein [Rhizomicrobium sp.]